MANKPPLTDEDRAALEQIHEQLRRYPGQIGRLEDPVLLRYAHELLTYPPRFAIQKAHEFRDLVREFNDKQEAQAVAAKKRLEQLAAQPEYSLGRSGLFAVILRSFMASLNGTPLSAPNWYQLSDKGLRFYTPFAIVTERMVTGAELQQKRFELGVNPPAYFDALLGYLKQLRFKAQTPWGQITLREPGSGVTLAEVIEFWPERKLAQIRRDLDSIQRANDPYGKHLVLPKLVDFYSYYVDEWDESLTPQPNGGRTVGQP